jgi:tellurite resistance-related uncharacterized protein
VRRAISGYHRDNEGDWVADLSCGHGQHIRHRPPFQLREWVLDAGGRAARLGTPLDCALCDRAELPDGLQLVRTSPQWDDRTMPAGLKRSHRIAEGTWGRIVVHEGTLRFVAQTEPELNVIVGPHSTQAIPPEVEHNVEPIDQVCFEIEFLSIPDGERHNDATLQERPDEGGETACWAHLLCPECGIVLDGGPHVPGCCSDP